MNYKSTQTATTSGEPRSSENAGRTLALERHGIAHVPTSRRYGRPRNQFTVRFAPVIYLAGIYLGASGGPLGLGAGRSRSMRENSAQIGTPTYRSMARWNEISNPFHAMTHS